MGEIDYPVTAVQKAIQAVEQQEFTSLDVDTLGNGGSPVSIADGIDMTGSPITDSDDSVVTVLGDDIQLDTGSGTIKLTGRAPNSASYVTTADEPSLTNETQATDLRAVYGSPVTVGAADLRLDAGQSIEDESGNPRVQIHSSDTFIRDSTGSFRFLARDEEGPEIRVESGDTRFIRDVEGGFNAVRYDTSASAPGTLELTNADLDASGQSVTAGSVSTDKIDTNFRNSESARTASKFSTITLADGASSGAVDGISQPNGVLTVINLTFGTNALISLQGGGGGADIIADPQTDFSVTAGTSDSTNVFYSSSNSQYEIENNNGRSAVYRIVYLGTN